MPKKSKKRKSTAQHDPIPPPARPPPMDGRRHVSYEDLETNPTPPVPRHMVSYASSGDEDDEEVTGATKAAEEEKDGQAEVRHRIMSRESDGSYDNIRAQPRIDVTYGQFGAFPGLDSYQYAPFYGPANDGLDYLRMVRSEAREFPHVMTKKDRKRAQQDEEGEGGAEEDFNTPSKASGSGDGYYSDGAYVAKPLPGATARKHSHQFDPQEAYYDRLKDLFTAHRARCRASPSADAVAALDQQHPISFPQGSTLAHTEWKNLLITATPLPAQLCSMDRWTVWRLLRLCERHIRHFALRVRNFPPSLAQWIWGLLGRLEDCHQMGNEEVSKVRELGKCATFCTARYRFSKSRRDEMEALDGDEDEEGLDYDDDEDDTTSVSLSKPQSKAERAAPEVGTLPSVTREAKDEENTADTDIAMGNATEELKHDFSDLLAAKKHQLENEEGKTRGQQQQQEEADKQLQEESAKQLQDEIVPPAAESEEIPSAQTSAVLDFIITVAGEFYGQRDLLRSRHKWEKEVS